MIDKESHIRPIGYGAMLIEGTVGVLALVAAASMFPGDYFAINTTPRCTPRWVCRTSIWRALEAGGGRISCRPRQRCGLAGGREWRRSLRHCRA